MSSHEKSCLFFIYKFHLLPFDTTSRSLGSQLQPVLANRHGTLTPARISGRRPHCGSLSIKGAVTGRKYHRRRYRSLRYEPAMAHFQDRYFPLDTFDATTNGIVGMSSPEKPIQKKLTPTKKARTMGNVLKAPIANTTKPLLAAMILLQYSGCWIMPSMVTNRFCPNCV